VAATLANLLASELSLKPLVKRVNEDLRRDDMRVGQELELRYFDILYRVLHYNRLKLADEYAEHLQATAAAQTQPGAGAAAERLWEPNLKNVMDALDRMSFTRVVTAIERVGECFHALRVAALRCVQLRVMTVLCPMILLNGMRCNGRLHTCVY
jgi:hypothetical protein